MPESRIDLGVPSALTDPDDPTDAGWEELLDRTLAGSLVRSVFQPIVDLRRLVPVGYEALIRFDLGAMTPDRWFAAAAHHGLVCELEALSVASAARHRPDLPPDCFLSVNLEPESVLHPTLWRTLDLLGDLHGLVIEITEHRKLESYAALQPVLDRLRGDGALIAIDDAGAGHAGLQQILELRPSILKLDRALVEGVDRDPAKAALIESIGGFANRIDAWILAEGIETIGEALTLRQLDVPLVQGYLFGRPAAPWAGVEPGIADVLTADDWDDARPSLRPLIEVAPWVSADDLAPAVDRLVSDAGLPWVVALDRYRRPIGIVTPSSAIDSEVLPSLRAKSSDRPAEVARRLATVDDDPRWPVLVIDDAGRYVGVVTIRRLLGHLADRA